MSQNVRCSYSHERDENSASRRRLQAVKCIASGLRLGPRLTEEAAYLCTLVAPIAKRTLIHPFAAACIYAIVRSNKRAITAVEIAEIGSCSVSQMMRIYKTQIAQHVEEKSVAFGTVQDCMLYIRRFHSPLQEQFTLNEQFWQWLENLVSVVVTKSLFCGKKPTVVLAACVSSIIQIKLKISSIDICEKVATAFGLSHTAVIERNREIPKRIFELCKEMNLLPASDLILDDFVLPYLLPPLTLHLCHKEPIAPPSFLRAEQLRQEVRAPSSLLDPKVLECHRLRDAGVPIELIESMNHAKRHGLDNALQDVEFKKLCYIQKQQP